jgi:hypothetical protein
MGGRGVCETGWVMGDVDVTHPLSLVTRHQPVIFSRFGPVRTGSEPVLKFLEI